MNARQFLLLVLFLYIFSIPAFSAWTEPEPVFEVNSQYEEWSPFLSYDGLTLYFGRVLLPNSLGQIFEATRNQPSGPFTNIREIPGELNSSDGLVSCPWVSPDNLRMYYYVQPTGSQWKLMLSERTTTSSTWPAGSEVSELNSLGLRITAPKLTKDELIIVYQAPDMPGGQHDIYIATRSNRDLPFEQARILSEVCTSFNEAHPYISSDGLELYFVSNRSGYELTYKATRASTDVPFGDVEHVSFLDNGDECSTFPFITNGGKEFYFVRYLPSDRTSRNIYVSYYYPDNSFFVDANNGDDFNDGSSPQTPLATIQTAIDSAPEGYTIYVKPGVYSEALDFKGKAITIQGQAGPDGVPVLEMPDDFAIAFINDEGPDTILKNFVIRNSFMAMLMVGSSPTISNVTIVDNVYGIRALAGSNPDISNCIFWNNIEGDLSGCESRYSLTSEIGEGNIFADPMFADSENGDYHLKSKRGRYWSEHHVWVLDSISSPGIDTGDPWAYIYQEPSPNGEIINMGAYGGTPYASLSETTYIEPDFNKDGIIDELDLADLIEQWIAASGLIEQ